MPTSAPAPPSAVVGSGASECEPLGPEAEDDDGEADHDGPRPHRRSRSARTASAIVPNSTHESTSPSSVLPARRTARKPVATSVAPKFGLTPWIGPSTAPANPASAAPR